MCDCNKVPNLDAMSDSGLAEFIHHHAGGRNWVELFPVHRREIHATLATATLVHYAHNILAMRQHRTAGDHAKAKKAAAKAALEYDSLPEWAQW